MGDNRGMTWQFALLAGALVLVFGVMGATLATRSILRRRVKRAERSLPPARLSGPAVLIGTNVDDSMTGVGALAVTQTQIVFVVGSSGESLTIPLERARASGYRQSPNQRFASLRLDWDGLAAVFDVQKPGLDDWLDVLPAQRTGDV